MAGAVVQKPEIIYDEDSDILRLQFQDKPSVESVEVAEGVVLDYDRAGKVVAIEIDGAGQLLREFITEGQSRFLAHVSVESRLGWTTNGR